MQISKRLIFGFVVLLLTGSAYTQDERYQPGKVIPPSPTAASLGVYGDIPVGYYTGTASVSIPIYTIKTANHSLPIAINYSASGIKVAQDASWVGLGWSLAAGGVITRSVRGLDDFEYDYGYNMAAHLPPNDEYNSYAVGSPSEIDDRYYFLQIARKVIDGEPDIFYYNFGGYSGKFVMGKTADGNPVFQVERNSLNITYDRANLQWIVKTPDGYQYYFGVAETAEDYYKNSEVANFSGLEPIFIRSYKEIPTAWYLSLIRSPSGEEIKFTYDIGLSLSMVNISQKRYDRTGIIQGYNATMNNVYNYFNASRQVLHDVYLKKIEFTNGYILFNRTTRNDIEPFPNSSIHPEKLTEIIVYNNNNEQIKRFLLQHTYYNNNMGAEFNYTYKRLKLDAVTEYGKDNVAQNPYLLEYYNPDNLPGKYSRQMDDWGFYSNFYAPTLDGEMGPTLLPEVQTQGINGLTTFPGTNRESDPTGNFSKIGILTSVTYPTKGKSVFDYEVNEYKITPCTVVPQIRLAYVVEHDNNGERETDDFILNHATSVTFTPNDYTIFEETAPGSQVVAYLRNWNDNSIIQSFTLSGSATMLSLPAGHYYLQAIGTLDYHIEWEASYPDNPVTISSKKGGGIRIKTIINYDYNGNKLTAKKIIYTVDGTSSGLCTGEALSLPLKYYKRPVTIFANPDEPIYPDLNNAEFLVRSSSSTTPPGLSSAAAPVCYSKVWVMEGENGEGGATVYGYINSPVANTQFPELPVPFYGLNGKPAYTEIRNSGGVLLSRTEYTYQLKESYNVKGVKLYKPYPDVSTAFVFADGDVEYYDNISEWYVLSSQTMRNYLDNQAVVTNITYDYANPAHKQVSSQTTTGSDGVTLSKTFKYPHDLIAQQPYSDMVNSRYIIAPVIEESTFKGGVQTGATRTKFSNNWGNNIIAPETVESKQGAYPYEVRLRYSAYDNKGNVLEVSREADFTTSYIWGYNKSLPVVKAQNVTITELNTKVGEALNEMGYANGVNDLDNFLTTLGALTQSTQKTSWKIFNQKLLGKFPSEKVIIESYTYDPFTGITSSTDANNRVVYYEYDNMGRLRLQRDSNGNIVKSYKYNYRQ